MGTACPNCSAILPDRELAAGWCESCGKKLPEALIRRELGPPVRTLREPGDEPPPSRISHRRAFAALAFGVVCLLACGAVAFLIWRSQAEQRIYRPLASDLRPLVQGQPPLSNDRQVTIRERVLVWDFDRDDFNPAQESLGKERKPTTPTDAMTVVLVIDKHDELESVYSNGAMGYRRDLTIGVIEMPEKKVVGTYKIRGGPPEMFIYRKEGDRTPVIGDTVGPLTEWITERSKRRADKESEEKERR